MMDATSQHKTKRSAPSYRPNSALGIWPHHKYSHLALGTQAWACAGRNGPHWTEDASLKTEKEKKKERYSHKPAPTQSYPHYKPTIKIIYLAQYVHNKNKRSAPTVLARNKEKNRATHTNMQFGN
jgi:hypothetical protein